MNSEVNFDQLIDGKCKRLCKMHPQVECEFLFTGPSNETASPFKCVLCFEKNLDMKYLIPIKQIEMSDENTIFWNWPLPNNDHLLQNVKKTLSAPSKEVQYKDKIGAYFKELRAKIYAKIDELEDKMTNQADKLMDFKKQLTTQYNRLSAKTILKQDVLDSQTDFDKLSIRIRETIVSVLRNQQQIEITLEREIAEHSIEVDSVDFEEPKRIMESVLAQLSNVSIFFFDNLRKFETSHNPDNDLGNGNAATLFQLATNKLNNLSTEFTARLKNNFLRLRRVFDQAQFDNVYEDGKKRLELELLGENELAELRYFAGQLINNKQNPPPSKKKLWSSEQIFELISNPANQCNTDILRQLKEILQNINSYFSLFPIAGQLPLPIDFTKLSKNQLKNVDYLTKKITELSLAPKYNYSQAISPVTYLQFNSVQAMKCFNKHFFISNEQETEIKRVFTQLPILELLPFGLPFEQQLSWRFVKTYYQSSGYLNITSVEKGCLIYQHDSIFAQAVSLNVLQNELMYELKCTFNKPFDCNNIRIGLIQEEKIHSNSIGDNYDLNTIFISNRTGANTIIKGTQLTNSPLNKTLTTIKFRFCISTQQLYIFDECSTNIMKGDPSQIKVNGRYRFGVCFRTPGTEYGVTVGSIMAFKDNSKIDIF